MTLPKLDDLIKDLQTAKELAVENSNPNALVTATMAQAKLLGLDKYQESKQEHSAPVFNITGIERVIIDPKTNEITRYDEHLIEN